jgi:hypothetical protein
LGKPEGNKQLGTLGVDKRNNIKMDLKETDWEGAEWIKLAQDRYR